MRLVGHVLISLELSATGFWVLMIHQIFNRLSHNSQSLLILWHILYLQVSSFDTVANKGDKTGRKDFFVPRMPRGCDENDVIRWRNSLQRDFTINRYYPFYFLFVCKFGAKSYLQFKRDFNLRALKLKLKSEAIC